MELTKLSLFSGIGGDDIASEWAGIKTICFVENDKFCQKVLKKHWNNTPIIGDIRDVTKEKIKEATGQEWVNIITGGDPCQPRSIAGQRRGREDDHDLWSDMFGIICELKPTWVVNENPTGRLTMDFHEVLFELESQGYDTRTFVIPACAVNAPHRRDRVFIIAYNDSYGCSRSSISISERRPQQKNLNISGRDKSSAYANGEQIKPTDKRGLYAESSLQDIITANSQTEGLQRFVASTWEQGEEIRDQSVGRCYRAWGANWVEVATAFCGVDDGIPYRMARLKALGNTVVPQQIYPIYIAIMEVEMEKEKQITEAEVENLLDKASQPLEQGQSHDSESEKTSESPTSGDCNGTDTRSDKSGDI